MNSKKTKAFASWYLSLLEKDTKNIFETVFYYFLCLLSFGYGIAVGLKNFLYDKKILATISSNSYVISIGNLSWGGAGKTTLALLLYEKLFNRYHTALLRRGYGNDEELLLKEKAGNVFSSARRYKLAKKLEDSFEVFILDDGFQHRKLKRDIDIVVMGAREFKKAPRLIPAYFFREPLKSLRRTDIVLLNYRDELEDPESAKRLILNIAPQAKIYFSRYIFSKIVGLNGKECDLDFLKNRKLAAFSAVGYPSGFFNMLKKMGLEISKEIAYPDHCELSIDENAALQNNLWDSGIRDLIVTAKDKYRFFSAENKLNILILEIAMEIEQGFFETLEHKIEQWKSKKQ